MLVSISMPVSSKSSAGSSETISSMFFAITKVSFGVAACAGASAEAGFRGDAVADDLDLESALRDIGVSHDLAIGLDIAEADGAAHRVAEHAGGEASHERAVPPDGLAVIEHTARVLEREGDEAALGASLFLPQERVVADEAAGLAPRHGEAEAGFEGRVLLGDVVAPVPVGFLDPERVEGVVAGVTQAETVARRDDRVVDPEREF